jgi:lysozyme
MINAAGVALVKRWEALRLDAYLCPAGVPTIGYGHTGDVSMGQRITEHQADAILAFDLERVAGLVATLAPVCTENQRAALVSFTFNLGSAALARSTLLTFHNAGLHQQAAGEFKRWVWAKTKAGMGRLPGLVARREAERNLYLTP